VGVISLARTRWRLSEAEAARLAGGTTPMSLEALVQLHRGTEATDPRDKVYAFLGLADKIVEARAPIEPNYRLPVHQVYTDVTERVMLSNGNLHLLSHVQDASQTKVSGLPSWVPDYSVQIKPYPLFLRGNCNWSASGRLRWRPDAAAMRLGLLHVQGFRIGNVEEAAAMPDEVAGSAAYWSSIVRVATGLGQHYRHRPETKEGRAVHTRVEALWRTLITNTYERTNPAPDAVGTLFLDYVLNLQVRHTLAPLSNVDFLPHQRPTRTSVATMVNEEADAEGGTGGGALSWHALLAAEPQGSALGADAYSARISSVVERMFRGAYSPIGLAQLQHEFDIASGGMRRVFRARAAESGESDRGEETDGERPQLLGTGPRSLRAGDEVWVLAGASVPMVLRQADGGGHGARYRLVGEAYVHGAMQGGAEATESSLADLVLE
jgi:hypothetical protein